MTKLFQWLLLLGVLSSIYWALITKQIRHEVLEQNEFLVTISPIILIGLLGMYAVTTVLYRTFTFNDCNEASEELQKQIEEAKKDLRAKGLKLD